MISKKIFSVSMLLILACVFLNGESRFSLNTSTELILGSTALGLAVPAFILESSPRDDKEVSQINMFDRHLVFGFDKNMDTVASVLAVSSLTLPCFSLMERSVRNNWLTYGVMYAEAFVLTSASKSLLKGVISRNRPYCYIEEFIPMGEEDDYYNSFPSGHTAYAFLSAGFLTTTLLLDAPESNWTIPLIIGSYTLATTVGGLRIASGSHFLSDVLAGAFIGSFFGTLIPILHLNKSEDLQIIPKPGGVSVQLKF